MSETENLQNEFDKAVKELNELQSVRGGLLRLHEMIGEVPAGTIAEHKKRLAEARFRVQEIRQKISSARGIKTPQEADQEMVNRIFSLNRRKK